MNFNVIDINDFLAQEQRQAAGIAVQSLEDNPDDAARAVRLSDATGTPAPIIHGDLENFEREQKASIATSLISENKFIQDYINNHAMAAKVSNDDYGQLDAVSKSVGDYLDVPGVGLVPTVAYGGEYLSQTAHVIADALKSLKEGPQQFKQVEADTLAYLINQGIPEAEAKMKAEQAGLSAYRGEAITNTLFAVPTILASPVIAAFQTFISKPIEAATGFPAQTTDILSMSLLAAMGMVGARARPKIGEPKSDVSSTADIIQFLKDVDTYSTGPKGEPSPIKALIPYIEDGKTPPPGVHPFTDAVHTEQAKTDAKNLSTAMSEVAKSATRERSPELFTNYLKGITDGEIGISADAVRALYGDKVPVPGEGPLGFIPDLAAQLERAEEVGGDIQVALAEWLGKVEPDVARELEDHIRRPGGITVEEGKNLPTADAYHGSPHEFDAFDNSKIGSGEGAQAFAYGHYLAESPDLAKFYQIKLGAKAGTEGSIYGVKIKQPKENFLSWEDDMTSQPVGRAILEKMDPAFKDRLNEYLDEHGQGEVDDLTGGMFHRALERYASEDDLPGVSAEAAEHPKRAVAEYLSSLDVPGVAFFDKKSRADGAYGNLDAKATSANPTRNYVVFSDKDLEIVHRNNQAVDTIRQAAGLKGVQEAGLSLQELKGTPGESRRFNLLGTDKKPIGNITITPERDGKVAYVDMINLPGKTGVRALLSLLPQVAEAFPQAERLKGEMVSGAREAAGKSLKVDYDLTKYRVGAPEPAPQPGLLQQVKEAVVGKTPEQLKLDLERVEEKDIFDKASAIGRTVVQYKRLMKLIDKQQAEDVAAAEKRAEREVKRRLTPEWKANRVAMREQVREEMMNVPEVELDAMLREGEVKLLADYVTPEQGKILPKEWITAMGMHPNDLASFFGGTSAQALVKKVTGLVSARKAANMSPKAFFDRTVDIQTDKSMEAAYGNLDKNILEEAKDQVLSETQMQWLHEDTLMRAENAKTELSFTKEDALVWSKARVDGMLIKRVSSDAEIATAGRAGRAIEDALIKEDAIEAFHQQQRQYFALLDAKQAMRLERAMEKFDRTAAKYKNAMVPGVDPATRNYVHALLKQAGYPIKLTAEEIAASGAFEGHGTLADYANYLGDFGIDTAIPESILEGGVKPLEQMTTAEFYEFKDAIDTLDHIGREQLKITVAGETQDYADWKGRALEALRERPIRDAAEAQKGGKWAYRLDAPMTRTEEMFKDFDMRQELGPFFEALVIPYEQSKAKSYEMLEKLSKDLKGPGFKKKWQKSLDDPIPNDFIWDVWNETMFDLNRWNMIKMMMNWGNDSNAMKLSEGILRAGREVGDKISKDEIQQVHDRLAQLFDTHATAEDWAYVQKMWDMFEGWKEPVETLHRNMTGQAPKWVKGREVVTPHGTFQGGYFPLIPDKLRRIGAGIRDKGQPDTGPLGPDYFRANTNQKHLKTRTGATYFVDITSGPEQLVGRMQQVIHDLAYRDFVVNAGKVLYDTEVQNAIQKHYGIEYQEQLIPWLKRVANQSNAPERELQGWNDVLKRFRGNLVAASLPLNYSVMFSPSVGLANVKGLVQFNANRAENKALVMANSKEIPHMLYNLDRDITEAIKTSAGKNDWTSYQLMATEKMFKPLLWMEQQFRMSTFYTEFMAQKAKGRTDFEASALADSKVREQHSVAAVGDLPALMASNNEFVKLSTLFMGYFTSQRNWMRQLPHYAREREWANFSKVLWGSIVVSFMFNALLFTNQTRDEGMLSYLARAALSVPLAGIPLIRNVWGYYSEGYRSTDTIISLGISVGKLGKDGWDWLNNKPVKKPIKDLMSVLGGGFGVPGSVQIGRTAQGLTDAATGAQRPNGIVEWMRLVLKGEAQLKK